MTARRLARAAASCRQRPARRQRRVTIDEDPANAGNRREPELPEHEEIVPSQQRPDREFEALRGRARRRRGARRELCGHCGASPVKRPSIPATASGCEAAMRTKHRLNVYLPTWPDEAGRALRAAQRLHGPLVAEAAIASFLSPDAADRLEAAIARRLDRIDRRIDGWSAISGSRRNAGRVRPLLADHRPRRYPTARRPLRTPRARAVRGFVEALGRRLARGPTVHQARCPATSRPRVQ